MKNFFAKFTTWYVISYLVIIAVFAYISHLSSNDRQALKAEITERRAFDARREYDICLESNRHTKLVNERFENLDRLLVSFGDPNDPRAKTFLEKERAAALPYRDCEALLRVSKNGP